MVVGGEDITHGDHHKAREVNDLGLVELLGVIKLLQSGRDLAGVDLRGAPQFLVGSTVKIPSDDVGLEAELADLELKIAAGASFFVTPPVYGVEALEKFRFIGAMSGKRAAIIPTVLLLKSVGMARYINRHLEPKIPEHYITRIQKAPDRVRECVQIAAEIIMALKAGGFDGVNISTIGWEDKLPAILAAAGLEFGV
jgi:5,10-methylenetetrahydrofolate reductase